MLLAVFLGHHISLILGKGCFLVSSINEFFEAASEDVSTWVCGDEKGEAMWSR